MASGKRASMREGPLAALFRRTEEDAKPEKESPGAPEADEPREGSPPEPATAAAREREPAEADQPDPTIPTPRERLRHAFSADIPENIMDSRAAAAQPAPSLPATPSRSEAADAYARPGGEFYGQPGPVGAPVIRVVGVGGGVGDAV